jgi:hypothetical protein
VVTHFLAVDLAYQDFPESQLRDSTGLFTGFAFKPPYSGWAPKSIYLIKWIVKRFRNQVKRIH